MTDWWPWLRDLGRKHLAGILAAMVVVGLVYWGSLEGLEHWSLDKLFEWRGPRHPTLPVVIVTIDESSMAELNEQWPFPRALHGQLISTIALGKPRAIAVDIMFDTPSSRGSADDEALGAAVTDAGNVILGAAVTDDIQPFYTRTMLNPPMPVIRHGAAGVAPLNMPADADNQVRRVPLWIALDAERLPGLDVQLHTMLAKSGVGVAPLPNRQSVLINFRGGVRTYPWVSYYRVVRGEIPDDYWQDKIVLVGPTSEVFHDQFGTAFARGGDMPGVEIHANALETLVRGDYIREVPQWVSTTLAVVAALLGCALVLRLRALRAFLAAAALWVILTLAAYGGFALAGWWMRGMAGTVALVLGYGGTVIEHFVREQRERRRLSQFFSPAVVREVVRHKDDGSLTTTRRLVTVLFSDIRGFTSLSEQLEPEQVAEMLREYLTEMTEIVFRNGGTVDKYIGDCVMALYNVPFEDPQHAIKAVRTGLEFQERTLAVSKRWEEKLGIAIRNGVGINTGEAVVGTLGSKQRLEYTAIGDTINLGARLESITKDYKSNIIISESTYVLVKDHFVTKELGDVTVKGKTRPVKIYAVLPDNIRKHPRATLAAAATLSLAGDGRTCRVATRDISEGGMALHGVPEEWTPGQVVQIRCEGGALPKPIVAEALIAWRRGDEVGVTFTSLEPDSAPMVAEYLGNRAK
jgi:CHASE2 domain-containing sensor protein/class 3 adenylate cyclase